MNRIYLEKISETKYLIRDILDNKKYGVLRKYNDAIMVKVKKKYLYTNVGTEARLSNNHFHLEWKDFWQRYLKHYNKDIYNIDSYNYPLFVESPRLKKCKKDMFDRDVYLHPAAKKAWKKMKKAAKKAGIKLQIISAFRSYDYQKQLIKNKLDKGLSIEEILKVNTLPGYSEHHTGCAIDIGVKNEAILEEEFDQSEAFDWLQQNAEKFDFFMSYPKNNTTGICYEPWHWCYRK